MEYGVYSLTSRDKHSVFLPLMRELTERHIEYCATYRKILKGLPFKDHVDSVEDIPFIPVRLFKLLNLVSVQSNSIFKTLQSSGTTGQRVSKIYLDKSNAAIQSKVLVTIVSEMLGGKRLPMLIVDEETILKSRRNFNARAAGVLGFSMFGKSHSYALDQNMRLKLDSIEEFCNRHRDSGIFVFGFTFVVWSYLCQELQKIGVSVDMGRESVLIHGGGWKRLADQLVSNETFKSCLADRLGIRRVHNYYGMVEQTGTIFMECETGSFHTNIFSDIVVRDPLTYEPLDIGQEGIIQVLSLLPHSYPGHSLLTEDRGKIIGVDDCLCGRRGKYFRVLGRMAMSEARGCSDVTEF